MVYCWEQLEGHEVARTGGGVPQGLLKCTKQTDLSLAPTEDQWNPIGLIL